MSQELMALGALVSGADPGRESAEDRLALDQGIRASLLCTLLGIELEPWVWPFPALVAGTADGASPPVRMLAGLLDPLDGIGHLGTLAGASDLDPMDPGPSHTVLPATLAACVVVGQGNPGPEEGDAAVGAAVLAGVEAAWRLRSAITGTRPGVGFHSPGVFGAVAAAAAGARALGLDADRCASALAIALTRASGLAINSAASLIGMTHFGWGAAHGLEAALLASQGWDASRDVQRALTSLYGEGRVDTAAIAGEGARAVAGLVFKRYPCNIYLNQVAMMLDEVKDRPVDLVEIRMPWIPHLDCPAPRDIRQARNSAQGVAAIAGAGDTSYAAFSGPAGPWAPSPAVARLLANIELVADRDAPTRLNEAVVGVRAWRGGAVVQDATRPMRDLRGWGVEHARRLMGAHDAHGGVAALYGGPILHGFAHVKRRRLAAMGRQPPP